MGWPALWTLAVLKVHLDILEVKGPQGDAILFFDAPEQRCDPGQELRGVERDGQTIVGPEFEPGDSVDR